jgi:hypothetical protein
MDISEMGLVRMICDELRRHRLARSTERELQDAIEQVLSERCTLLFAREWKLTSAERIDFFVPPGIGIEVKMAGSVGAVTGQLWRYAKVPAITHLVLVTTRSQLRTVSANLLGKPVEVLYLSPI